MLTSSMWSSIAAVPVSATSCKVCWCHRSRRWPRHASTAAVSTGCRLICRAPLVRSQLHRSFRSEHWHASQLHLGPRRCPQRQCPPFLRHVRSTAAVVHPTVLPLSHLDEGTQPGCRCEGCLGVAARPRRKVPFGNMNTWHRHIPSTSSRPGWRTCSQVPLGSGRTSCGSHLLWNWLPTRATRLTRGHSLPRPGWSSRCLRHQGRIPRYARAVALSGSVRAC